MSDAEESGSPMLPTDVDLIRPLLDDFKSAKKGERRHVVRRGVTTIMASKDISHLRPLAQAKIIAQVKEQVKTWFHNNGRSRKSKDVVKYVRRWNIRQVVGALHQKEVEILCRDHSQAVPGDKAYLKSYQKVLKRYAEGLSDDQKIKYQNIANEWSDRSPPRDIQQRTAELHGAKYVKQFSRVMWQQCGMRLVVIEAHHDTKDELCIASHDFNHELAGEAFSDVRPDWQTEGIMDEWAKYAQSQMGADMQDGNEEALPSTKRKKKLLVDFDRDDNGGPILEDPSQMIARVMEPMVRQFMSIHYNIFSKGRKTAVDWTALAENQDAMIDAEYLPINFKFRDPSKMKKSHYQALLEHWYERQQGAAINTTFEFKGYWDSSSESVQTADVGDPSRQKQRKPRPYNQGSKKNVNAPMKRRGPPGIRAGDDGFNLPPSSDDENEDNDSEDGGTEHDAQSKKKPLYLPFSAIPRAYLGTLTNPKTAAFHVKSTPKANSRPKGVGLKDQHDDPRGGYPPQKKATGISKSIIPTGASETADLGLAAAKRRPVPKPAFSGRKDDTGALSPRPPVIQKKPRRPRYLSQPPDLGPQFERPATRLGGKRKADDDGMRATQESMSKKAKNDTMGYRKG